MILNHDDMINHSLEVGKQSGTVPDDFEFTLEEREYLNIVLTVMDNTSRHAGIEDEIMIKYGKKFAIIGFINGMLCARKIWVKEK